MLILTRYKAESILIGNDILLSVLRINNGEVTYGFCLPQHVLIRKLPEHYLNNLNRSRAIIKSKKGDTLSLSIKIHIHTIKVSKICCVIGFSASKDISILRKEVYYRYMQVSNDLREQAELKTLDFLNKEFQK